MAQWEALTRLAGEGNFFDLPAEVSQPENSDGSISIMTDDTHICVTAIGPKGSHVVCGEWLALKLNPRTQQLFTLVERLERVSE